MGGGQRSSNTWTPVGQAVGCRCVVGGGAGSARTQRRHQAPGWCLNKRGLGLGLGAGQADPAASLHVPPMALLPHNWRPAEEALPATPQVTGGGGGGIQLDNGGRLELRRCCRCAVVAAVAVPDSCD